MKLIYTLDTLSHEFSKVQFSGVIYLYGDLGAGKTTLSQFIATKLGVSEPLTSPTYVYYNSYDNLYHFDLYRAESYETFINIGGEEILDTSEKHIIVEWPEIIHDIFTPDISIDIQVMADGSREASVYYDAIPPRFLSLL